MCVINLRLSGCTYNTHVNKDLTLDCKNIAKTKVEEQRCCELGA